jgi:hypothetical protein
LEPVKHKTNCNRGLVGINHRIKTTCPMGHPYDWEYVTPRGEKERRCRRCAAETQRRYRARKRQRLKSRITI